MMASVAASSCVFCNKEYKTADSRPFPNSKSKDRIHNKCYVKKQLADKKSTALTKPTGLLSTESILERIARQESEAKQSENALKLTKLIEQRTKSQGSGGSEPNQMFFDLKAGIAKPHEKRRYLNHRNISEIAARYDDHGFQEETVGRAYDHTGKDLNTLGDSDKDQEDDPQSDMEEKLKKSQPELALNSEKRKHSEIQRDSTPRQTTRVKLDEKQPCWFCLSSAQVEKHLIISIGDFCYLSLAKGGLTDEHMLLIPIEHVDCLNRDTISKELLDELEQYKQALVQCFSKRGKGVVFFERNFRSFHLQLQVVPVPLELMDTIEENMKLASQRHFKNSNYMDMPKGCSLNDIIQPGTPYFYWQVEPGGIRFATQIHVNNSYFPIQLGRIVLAEQNILNLPDRIDWRRCTKSFEEYSELVRTTKNLFKEFDIM